MAISVMDVDAAGSGRELVRQVEEMLGPGGRLSKASAFEYRPQQQRMAMAIAEALEDRENLLIEAGTGVGKSLGYLIPSILFAVANHKKAIISTHTINLQEQLTGKDLPMLQQVLPVEFKYSMLKGRQNYLCLRRLTRALENAEGLFTGPEFEELRRIHEWAHRTEDGSLSDFEVEPDARVWQQVCSERGLCAPKLCGAQSEFGKEHGTCFFQKMRSRIMASDLLVVNHNLFFSMLGSGDEDNQEGILFKNDFVVFDEAHTVENVAARHIGLSVSSAQVRYALHRLYNPRSQRGLLVLARAAKGVELMGALLNEVEEFFASVEEACSEMVKAAAAAKKEGRDWKVMRIRKRELVKDPLSVRLQSLREIISEAIKLAPNKDLAQELTDSNRRLAEIRAALRAFLAQEAEDHVYWVERAGRSQANVTLSAAPVDIAPFLRKMLFDRNTSVVMTSATLSVSGREAPKPVPPASEDAAGAVRGRREAAGQAAGYGVLKKPGLGYFSSRVGGEEARQIQAGSPFDYQEQMRLYVVGKMPDPRAEEYQAALVHWIQHFVERTQGKAFVLFTSFKQMLDVASLMEGWFQERQLQCLVQGRGIPRTLMLERFKRDRDSVLFGTDSFWQGVDVPGEALSNVIITRLPFAVPDHPLIEARIEHIEARGGNSFMEFSLPEAILKFRQGVGRLIRTAADRGIVVILDNRVLSKRYGQAFLDALPESPLEIV